MTTRESQTVVSSPSEIDHHPFDSRPSARPIAKGRIAISVVVPVYKEERKMFSALSSRQGFQRGKRNRIKIEQSRRGQPHTCQGVGRMEEEDIP